MKDLLWLVWSIDVHQTETLHPLVVMADFSFNNTVSDSLRNDLLSFFDWLQAKLGHHIS